MFMSENERKEELNTDTTPERSVTTRYECFD